MKISLRLVYADGDVAATSLRPWRWRYAFVALLYPFYIESEIPNPSTTTLALLLRSCRFCYDSCHLTKISNRSGIAVQRNGGLTPKGGVVGDICFLLVFLVSFFMVKNTSLV